MKRQREPPVQYKIMNDYVVLNYNEKEYSWAPPASIALKRFLNEDEYDYEVVDKKDKKPVFTVENLRNNKHVFHQEISLLK